MVGAVLKRSLRRTCGTRGAAARRGRMTPPFDDGCDSDGGDFSRLRSGGSRRSSDRLYGEAMNTSESRRARRAQGISTTKSIRRRPCSLRTMADFRKRMTIAPSGPNAYSMRSRSRTRSARSSSVRKAVQASACANSHPLSRSVLEGQEQRERGGVGKPAQWLDLQLWKYRSREERPPDSGMQA